MDLETELPSLSDALSQALPEDTPPPETPDAPVYESTSETAEVAPPADTPSATLTAPEHWSSEWKSSFAAATPELQKWALDVESSLKSDYTKKTTELAEVRKALEPYRDQIKLRGMSEGQLINQLLAAQAALDRNPLETIKYFAKAYNVDLSKFAPQAPPPEDEFVDPQIKALRDEIKSLKEGRDQDIKSKQLQDHNQAQQQLVEFMAAKDEAGSPKYPHFESVRKAMGALMQSGDAKSLEEAYDKATWANSGVREQLLKAQQEKTLKEQEAKAEAERKAKVAQAKKAASKPSGKSPELVTSKKDLSSILGDVLSQHWSN